MEYKVIIISLIILFYGCVPPPYEPEKSEISTNDHWENTGKIIASFIWLLFNGWFMGLQYIDYAADNNKQSLDNLLKQMHKHRFDALSFGFMTMILSFIPIVNFIVMPVAVAGGTAMWLDWQKASR